jgi:peptidoglycan hydrolase CwlO-like protein
MKKILGLALGLTMIALTPALGNETKKTSINDHQTCIAEWATAQANGENYRGALISIDATVENLKSEVQSLRKVVEALLTKIPDAKN